MISSYIASPADKQGLCSEEVMEITRIIPPLSGLLRTTNPLDLLTRIRMRLN
jgi:hypothetical protein